MDQFTGKMLDPCQTFQPYKISAVKLTLVEGDGWKGEYLKISYGEKSFTCKLGQRLDKKTKSITFPCSSAIQGILKY